MPRWNTSTYTAFRGRLGEKPGFGRHRRRRMTPFSGPQARIDSSTSNHASRMRVGEVDRTEA